MKGNISKIAVAFIAILVSFSGIANAVNENLEIVNETNKNFDIKFQWPNGSEEMKSIKANGSTNVKMQGEQMDMDKLGGKNVDIAKYWLEVKGDDSLKRREGGFSTINLGRPLQDITFRNEKDKRDIRITTEFKKEPQKNLKMILIEK